MKFIFTFIGVMLSGLVWTTAVQAGGVPGTPTVLLPNSSAHTSLVRPVIAGVTQSNTQVDVYIDHQFNGRATVAPSAGVTAAWSYKPFLNLAHGWHTIEVKAQNAVGGRSAVSAPVYVYIDLLVPQPTLLAPVVNAETSPNQPWIVGLTKGGMTLDVWIDGQLNGSLTVTGTKTQTHSFRYQPFLPLSAGSHQVAVVAQDSFGGKSTTARLDFRVDAVVVRPTVEPEVEVSVVPTANTASEPALPLTTPAPLTEPVEPSPEPAQAQPVAPSTTGVQNNTLTTIGWVLLALVAIGLITRGRVKPKATSGDQLMKIDTTESTPYVEVIRKQEPPSTPPAPPSA